jgi:hypothetical protein
MESSNENLRHPKKALGPYASVALGTLVGFFFFFGGYLLAVGNQESFSLVMFLLVPFMSGLTMAAVIRPALLLVACCASTSIFTLTILIVTGLEGYICCLMALPLLAIGMAFGALVGYFARGRLLDSSEHSRRNLVLVFAACPLLLTTADRFERPLRTIQRAETFVTSIEIAATPQETWQQLVRMSRLQGDKPFLLRIGLPVPQRCTLEGESVGARRVCYFDQGIIGQEVTEWKEPQAMAVTTTECTLPGRHWLEFIDANYQLKATPTGTLVERRTTIGSRLYPRWYWRPLEAWGVESEHGYVLTSVKNSVEARR